MKKVLFILHLPPPVHGPAVIGEFIRQSKKINSEFDCTFLNLSTSSSINELGSGSLSKFFRFLQLIVKVKWQLIFNRPDLSYITLNSKGSGFYKDSVIALLVRLFRVKRVYHFHNKGITSHKLSFFADFLYKLTFSKADVILISERLYYDFKKIVPENRVHYCTNGIHGWNPPFPDIYRDTKGMGTSKTSNQQPATQSDSEVDPIQNNPPLPDSYRDLPRRGISLLEPETRNPEPGTLNPEPETRNPEPGTCNLMFLSNLFESKGTFILLDACRLLKDKNLKFHCTFSGGEGDITSEMFHLKVNELGLGDCVTYEGMKLGKGKEKVFSEADIFVHPTSSDCLPLVILEAMQYSLPVVSTDEGAIPDAVENGVNGYVISKNDPVSLAGKIELLINDSELRKKMGSEGRRKYEMEFTFEKFELRLSDIFSRLSNN